MPTVIATLTNLKASIPYKRAAVINFIDQIERWAGSFEEFGDSLSLSITNALTTTVTQVTDSAARVYGVLIESPAGSTVDSYVQVFNTDDTDVTLGTTAPRLALACPAAETVAYPIHSAGSANMFGTGCSVAATTTPGGLTALAAADRPKVTVLYA